MSKWNGKLKCVEDYRSEPNIMLIKDRIYDVNNGILTYEDGWEGCMYDNFKRFKEGNPSIGKCLVEIFDNQEKTTKEPDWNIEQSKSAMYIMINETVTIAIPKNTQIGISFKHPEDEYCEEIGQALALKRLLEY